MQIIQCNHDEISCNTLSYGEKGRAFMDINKYVLFVKAAEVGNLTRAAMQLSYTQTAASHMISSLEDELGVKLLYRGRNGVSVTEEGEQILSLAKEIVINDERIHQIIGQEGVYRGNVRIGVITSVAVQWMPKIIRKFRKKYPLVELQINDAINYEWIKDWFSKDEIDCAFTAENGMTNGNDIPLISDPYYVIMSKHHPLCRYEKITKELLAGETFVIPSEGTNYSIGKILRQAKGRLLEHTRFLSDQSTIALVRSECGISILPELVLNSYSCEGLVRRKLEPEVSRTICLCLPNRKYISPSTKAFVAFIQKWVQKK